MTIRNARRIERIPMQMDETVRENYFMEGGAIARKPYRCDIPDWDDAERLERMAEMNRAIADGGMAFECLAEGLVVGIATVASIKLSKDRVQLATLHVDARYRKRGVGKALMRAAVGFARDIGARGLYISASPKINTVDFYLRLGAALADPIEPALFALEPEDIHLELMWA